MKKITTSLFFWVLFVLAISPIFAASKEITVDFEDKTSFFLPFSNGIYRFEENYELLDRVSKGDYMGFRFTHFGILEKERQDPLRGFYLGNAASESNYVGYSDNNYTASIERDTPFTFLGGCFTPGNYTEGWVSLIGYGAGDSLMYSLILGISLPAEGEYANYYDLSDYGGVFEDIIRLEIVAYGEWDANHFVTPTNGIITETKRQFQIVMDNLTFLVDDVNWLSVGNSGPPVMSPEPATIAVLGLVPC